jgi:formylglycine-generating enzyme required for sulfatase activity
VPGGCHGVQRAAALHGPGGRVPDGQHPKKDEQFYDNEKPRHRVMLPSYQIARFPITVVEYDCFVRSGHDEPMSPYNQLSWQ